GELDDGQSGELGEVLVDGQGWLQDRGPGTTVVAGGADSLRRPGGRRRGTPGRGSRPHGASVRRVRRSSVDLRGVREKTGCGSPFGGAVTCRFPGAHRRGCRRGRGP